MTDPVFVFGGGGHAKVVISTLRAMGETVGGIYDDGKRVGDVVLGVDVQGPIAQAAHDDVQRAVIAIGSNAVRKTLATSDAFAQLEWVSAVHPSAILDDSVVVGPGSVVFANAVVQPDSRIGSHCILNTAASVDHDGDVRDFSQISPGAHLAGTVTVDEGVFIGTGASIIPGVVVGAWSTVGAGACVVRDVPAHATQVGVPAHSREPSPTGA